MSYLCSRKATKEGWQSGRLRRSWKPLRVTPPGVRIPLLPLRKPDYQAFVVYAPDFGCYMVVNLWLQLKSYHRSTRTRLIASIQIADVQGFCVEKRAWRHMECYHLSARTRLIASIQVAGLRGFSTIRTANRRVWFVFTIYLYLNCRRLVLYILILRN